LGAEKNFNPWSDRENGYVCNYWAFFGTKTAHKDFCKRQKRFLAISLKFSSGIAG
jgi:hypothetical protein